LQPEAYHLGAEDFARRLAEDIAQKARLLGGINLAQ
jgi:hypothetical protein